MGNSCTVPSKANISIPSRVMMIGPKKLILSKARSESSANSLILPKLSTRADSQALSITSKERSIGAEPMTSIEIDDDQKVVYQTAHPLALQYDLQELGIGEHYLEEEFSEIKVAKTSSIKKTVSNEWDTIIILMRNNKVNPTSPYHSLSTEVDSCIKEFSFQKPKVYFKMLKKGPPMRYRWSVWKNILDPDRFYIHGLYEKLKELSSQWENDIRKDIHRTFPNEAFFVSKRHNKVGQSQLFNTLKAVSLYFPNVGYLQGMNFLMGFLLMVNGGNELDAFWAFVTLSRDSRYLMIGFFERGFPMLDFYLYIFHKKLEEELPDVHEHLKQQNIPDQMWVFKWFLTVFLFSVPQVHEIKIWDFVMSSGLFSIVQIAIAILKVYEKTILELDSVGLDQFFRHVRGESGRIRKANERLDSSHINANQSIMQSQNVNGSIHQISTLRNNVDGENPASVCHETSDFQYVFEEFEIDKVLRLAEKVPLTVDKIVELAQTYRVETTKKLPDLYVKYLEGLKEINFDVEKQAEIQREIDFSIMKSQLAEKVNEEIVVSNLLDNVEHADVLNDL